MGTRTAIPRAYKYVNRMLNVSYITGFVSETNKKEGWFKIAQTVNKEQDIIVQIEPGDNRIPGLRTAVTATCHVRGKEIENPQASGDGKATEGKIRAIHLSIISLSQANVLNIPAPAAYFGKARDRHKVVPKGVDVDESRIPYENSGALKEGISVTQDEEGDDDVAVIRKIMEAGGGRFDTKLGHNSNVVFVAGCVENAYIKKGNEYSSKDRLEIILRQSDKVEDCLIVRYEPDSGPAPQAYASRIKKGFPIKVLGEVRVKPLLNDAGDILGHQCYIRAREIYSAEIGTDIQKLPVWWIEKSRLMTENDKRKGQLRSLESARPTDTDNAGQASGDSREDASSKYEGHGW